MRIKEERQKERNGYTYFLHFKCDNQENTNVVRFSEVRRLSKEMFLLQYFEYDHKDFWIANIKGHQIHVKEEEIVRISIEKEDEKFHPSYVLHK